MYGRAVLDHVQDGTYPESEDVISANLPTSALPEVLKLIRQARDDIKVRVWYQIFDYELMCLLVFRPRSEKTVNLAHQISMAGSYRLSSYVSILRSRRR